MSRNQESDKKRLLALLQKTPIVEAACKKAGLPRSTYYRWRKDDEAFAELCDETIETSIGRINDLAESQLINAIKNQNMTAITFWLKHHHGKYRTKVELNGSMNHFTEELSDEQIALVQKSLNFAGLIPAEVSDEAITDP
jgi:hypothetical protein